MGNEGLNRNDKKTKYYQSGRLNIKTFTVM